MTVHVVGNLGLDTTLSLARSPAMLRNKGVGTLAVNLGRHSALLFDRDGRVDAAAPHVTARDTSGAGDVFCGVFVAHPARGDEPGESLAQAIAAASLSVTGPCALASCRTANELATLPIPSIRRSPR